MTPDSSVEVGLVDKRVGLVGRVSHKVLKAKTRRRRKWTMKHVIHSPVVFPRTTRLQRLSLICQDIFKAPQTVPSSTDVQRLQRIIDAMLSEDVGLNSGMQFFKQQAVVRGSARVNYATIYQCKDFSISLFFIPSSAIIPLHNHPGMTVFSKLLLGTMHMKSYDLIEPPTGFDIQKQSSKLKLARLKTNKILSSPCDSTVLYPTSGGNIHEFKAVTPCAMLDVLGPPYSKGDGRDCSYYRECDASFVALFSNGEMSKEDENNSFSNAWLEEIEPPEESEMGLIEYMGPPAY